MKCWLIKLGLTLWFIGVCGMPASADPGDNYDNGSCYSVQIQSDKTGRRTATIYDIRLKPRCYGTYAKSPWILVQVGTRKCDCFYANKSSQTISLHSYGGPPKVLSPTNNPENCKFLKAEYPKDCEPI